MDLDVKHKVCFTCNGDGKCRFCKGLGVYQDGEPCDDCYTKPGICNTCRGKGFEFEVYYKGRPFRVSSNPELGYALGFLLLLIGTVGLLLAILVNGRISQPLDIVAMVASYVLGTVLVLVGRRRGLAFRALQMAESSYRDSE